MTSDKPIPINTSGGGFVAPTPQNTPLNPAPIGQGLSKPTVPDIAEGEEKGSSDEDDDEGGDEAQAILSGAMLGMVQNKLAGLVGKSSGYVESLPLPVRRRVEALKGVHTKFSELELQYRKEVLELDKKYLGLYKPLFGRRSEILNGLAEPTDDEIKLGEEQTLKDDPEAVPLSASANEPDAEDDKGMKGIPEFWLTALRNHTEISELITERDEDALKRLTDISLDYLSDKQGYTLTFHFAPNQYFENETLTKTYYYQGELGYGGEFIYSHAEGTKIKWKDGKNLTEIVEQRTQRNKNTNKTRIVKKTKKTPSFFDFFSPPEPVDEEAIKSGDIDEEALEELEYKLDMDYEVGEDLKERVIPRAIDWFTGKALDFEIGADSDVDEDDEGDEVEDSESSSDEDAKPKGKGRPTKKGGKSGGGQGGEGECKNQ